VKDSEKVLRVAEARSQDAGRGVARVDPVLVDALRLEIGGLVSIEGKRTTVARGRAGRPEPWHRPHRREHPPQRGRRDR